MTSSGKIPKTYNGRLNYYATQSHLQHKIIGRKILNNELLEESQELESKCLLYMKLNSQGNICCKSKIHTQLEEEQNS